MLVHGVKYVVNQLFGLVFFMIQIALMRLFGKLFLSRCRAEY